MNIKKLKSIIASDMPLQKKYAHVYCEIDEMQCRKLALSCAYVVRDNPDIFDSKNLVDNDMIKLAEQYVNGEITKQQMHDMSSFNLMMRIGTMGLFACAFMHYNLKKNKATTKPKTIPELNEKSFRDSHSIMVACVFTRLIADNGFDTYESCNFALMSSVYRKEKAHKLLLASLKKFVKSL